MAELFRTGFKTPNYVDFGINSDNFYLYIFFIFIFCSLRMIQAFQTKLWLQKNPTLQWN